MTKKTIDWYARKYCEQFNFHLVPIEPKRKFPRTKDWGENCITDPAAAEAFYKQHPTWNMGIALGPSGMCSLDIDHLDSFKTILDEFGIPIEELEKYPTIKGGDKGHRVLFRVPEGVELNYQKLNWPQKEDAKKQFTVFELRAATDGKARQDIAPPSWHEEAQRNYAWMTQPPSSIKEWPEPPHWLLAIWEGWATLKPQMQMSCPWSEKEIAVKAAPRQQRASTDNSSPDVIGQYTSTVSLPVALEAYGYQQKGRRWLSPHSGTGLAGVHILPDGARAWIHHASDPLCSAESGAPVNSFDLFCYYEHNGDVSKAVKAAAKALGIVREPNHEPNPQPEPRQVAPAPSTGALVDEYPEMESLPAVNHFDPLPYANSKGKPLKHIENLKAICERLGVHVRYNVITKAEEVIIPNQSFSVDNQANASLAWLVSECSRFEYGTDKVPEFLCYLADKNLYNPVAEWIDSKPWDGVSRLPDIYKTITARDEDDFPERKDLKEILIKRWMISAVIAGFDPNGVSAGGALVFQGAQYMGKTQWFKNLVPAELGLVKDGMILKPDDKDSVKQVCSFWLVELGELDSTFRKSDLAALKAFLTSSSDVLRRPYARKESHYARRTVFFGSVNPRGFLQDATGNRRYWTIETVAIDHDHSINMQQLWAEIKTLWQAGESHYLNHTEMEMLNNSNEEFMAADPIEERILNRLDWQNPNAEWKWKTTTEVLLDCGVDRPTRSDTTSGASIIRKHNGGRGKRSNGQNLLLVPPRKLTLTH